MCLTSVFKMPTSGDLSVFVDQVLGLPPGPTSSSEVFCVLFIDGNFQGQTSSSTEPSSQGVYAISEDIYGYVDSASELEMRVCVSEDNAVLAMGKFSLDALLSARGMEVPVRRSCVLRGCVTANVT